MASNEIVNMVRCGTCGLVYLHPQPVTQVRTKYIETYDLAEHFAPLAPRKRVLYERRFARISPPVAGTSRVCDVGCGDGQFLGLAKERGWVPYGIEMNPPAAARARERGATVSVGVLEELDDLEWGTFDLVTSWDVLEHTPTPRQFAERLVRLLAPHGTLVVTTLNLPSLAWRAFGTKWSMVGEDHFTYWDRRSMTALFESLGLEVLDCDIFGLGRDFVRSLDRWRGRGTSSNASAASTAPPPEDGGWDVSASTLAVEGVLNRVFRTFGGGVGIGLTMRRAGASGRR